MQRVEIQTTCLHMGTFYIIVVGAYWHDSGFDQELSVHMRACILLVLEDLMCEDV